MNGTEVLHLAHLKELVEGAADRFVRFELEDERVMVVERWGRAGREEDRIVCVRCFGGPVVGRAVARGKARLTFSNWGRTSFSHVGKDVIVATLSAFPLASVCAPLVWLVLV